MTRATHTPPQREAANVPVRVSRPVALVKIKPEVDPAIKMAMDAIFKERTCIPFLEFEELFSGKYKYEWLGK